MFQCTLSTGCAHKFIVLFAFILTPASAQVLGLTNASVSGAFFFRQLQFTTNTSLTITDVRSALGTMTFDGAGHYSLNAQQTVNNLAVTTLTGTGTYSISPSGAMTIGNPQRNTLFINARVGTEAIVGSSTESGDNTFDLFIAVPAATPAQAAVNFNGTYYAGTLEFPLSVGTNTRSAFFNLTPSTGSYFALISGFGHALNISSGQVGTFQISGASYSLNGDGTAVANFGATNNYLSSLKDILISASGNIILGGSMVAGTQDFMIGVRAFTGNQTLASWSGLFYTGGLRYDARNLTSAGYVGSANAIPSLASLATYQREHQVSATPSAFDFTGYLTMALNAGGTYSSGPLNLLGLGPSGTSFADADLASSYDYEGFSIDFGIAANALAGSGVYINPQGILNGASFSPSGGPIAPGEFITIFGTGLATAQTTATPPYPVSLGGVMVTVNGVNAPIYLVSATQLNVLVPYSVTGSTATIVVTNNGTTSNSVTVPLSTTAPGVFTLNSAGVGPGAILHSNNTVVNTASPAKPGETVMVYLTGLGAVHPSVMDGTAGLSDPLSNVTETVTATIANLTAKVTYAGLAPGLPGLYQVNVVVPNGIAAGNQGLAIQTPEAYAQQATIAVQ
jgi:uncharacterized protein (TIGR03437 family)